jgi:NosR/NirI family nitrous oxide reductase transcriptional regulator
MHCQELYFDDHRCPHMIQVRLKREKRQALSPPSIGAGGNVPATDISADGKRVGTSSVVIPPAT